LRESIINRGMVLVKFNCESLSIAWGIPIELENPLVVSVKVRTFEFRVNLGTGSSSAFSPRGELQSLRDRFFRHERLLLLLFPKPFHVQVAFRAPARSGDVPQSRRD
jgi:hypothetical protein